MKIADLRRLLADCPDYLTVYVSLPDNAGELELHPTGSVIDHGTYGWLTIDGDYRDG